MRKQLTKNGKPFKALNKIHNQNNRSVNTPLLQAEQSQQNLPLISELARAQEMHAPGNKKKRLNYNRQRKYNLMRGSCKFRQDERMPPTPSPTHQTKIVFVYN